MNYSYYFDSIVYHSNQTRDYKMPVPNTAKEGFDKWMRGLDRLVANAEANKRNTESAK